MEKLLITLTMRTRVEPDPNEVVRALVRARDMKGRLWVLGTNGSRRALRGEQVAAFGENDRYMKYAENGLLYYEAEPELSEQWAFSPGSDAGTQLPVLLERYDVAFGKRSLQGVAAQVAAETKQAELVMDSKERI